MTTLSSILRERREELGISREALAEQINIAPSYVAALENPKQSKSPSVETLGFLLRVLAARSPKIAARVSRDHIPPDYEIDEDAARRIIEAALALQSPLVSEIVRAIDPDQEVTAQSQLERNAEIWVISDTIGEASEPKLAQATAQNILTKHVRYAYFVPPTISPSRWKGATDKIKDELGDQHAHLADECLRVYEVSECAFGCRMRISNPMSASPDAYYSIGGRTLSSIRLIRVPPDLVTRVVDALSELRKAHEGSGASDVTVIKEYGAIRRLFPTEATRNHRAPDQ